MLCKVTLALVEKKQMHSPGRRLVFRLPVLALEASAEPRVHSQETARVAPVPACRSSWLLQVKCAFLLGSQRPWLEFKI